MLNDTKYTLDESTSNIDVESKSHIKDILKQKQITVINCTHNIEDFDYQEHYLVTIQSGKEQLQEIAYG